VFIREVYDRLYWISLWAVLTGQVFMPSLRVRYKGRLYCTIYGSRLFVVLRLTFLTKFTDQIYESCFTVQIV